jgi:hypothetical protein
MLLPEAILTIANYYSDVTSVTIHFKALFYIVNMIYLRFITISMIVKSLMTSDFTTKFDHSL